jgi:histidinol-phosphate aminotransferase
MTVLFAKRFQHLHEIERRRIVMPDGVRMRLSRLERPEPWQAAFLEELRASLPLDRLQQYPDYTGFYERLAAFAGCDVGELVVGAGIEEHIRSLFMLCADPGDKVAILYPTCAMFEIYARAFGAELVKIVTDPAAGLTFEQLVQRLPTDLKLLLIANPGQPVETLFSRGSINLLAELCRQRDAVLAVDEAYHGFGAPTAMGLQAHHENLVILRTFSKAFGAASIRLGYAVGSTRVIAALNAVRQSGEVSALSMHIATALMDRWFDVVAPGIDAICDGRDFLASQIAGLDFPVWGLCANHVLVELPDARGVADRLAARGILVKANFPAPVDRHMLVTCGGPALMSEFFDEFRRCL